MEKQIIKNILSVLVGSFFFYLIGLVCCVKFLDMTVIAESNQKIILGYDEQEQRFIFNENRSALSVNQRNNK